MQLLISESEFAQTPGNQLVPLKCKGCKKEFLRKKNVLIKMSTGELWGPNDYCGVTCSNAQLKPRPKPERIYVLIPCDECGKIVKKRPSSLERQYKVLCCKANNGPRLSDEEKRALKERNLKYIFNFFNIQNSDILKIKELCLNNITNLKTPIDEIFNFYTESKAELNCQFCNKIFKVNSGRIRRSCIDKYINPKRNIDYRYCCIQCSKQNVAKNMTTKIVECVVCKKLIKRKLSDRNYYKFSCCSKSCTMKHLLKIKAFKQKGSSRSKLEKWLEQNLKRCFPALNIIYNDRKIVGLELDIYIPSLKLAFELNGPTHYKQIYKGTDLSVIQSRDKRKLENCKKLGINLHIISTEFHKKSDQENNIHYFYYIKQIIDACLKWYRRPPFIHFLGEEKPEMNENYKEYRITPLSEDKPIWIYIPIDKIPTNKQNLEDNGNWT